MIILGRGVDVLSTSPLLFRPDLKVHAPCVSAMLTEDALEGRDCFHHTFGLFTFIFEKKRKNNISKRAYVIKTKYLEGH